MSETIKVNYQTVKYECQCCEREFEEPKYKSGSMEIDIEDFVSHAPVFENEIYAEDLRSFVRECLGDYISSFVGGYIKVDNSEIKKVLAASVEQLKSMNITIHGEDILKDSN